MKGNRVMATSKDSIQDCRTICKRCNGLLGIPPEGSTKSMVLLVYIRMAVYKT